MPDCLSQEYSTYVDDTDVGCGMKLSSRNRKKPFLKPKDFRIVNSCRFTEINNSVFFAFSLYKTYKERLRASQGPTLVDAFVGFVYSGSRTVNWLH